MERWGIPKNPNFTNLAKRSLKKSLEFSKLFRGGWVSKSHFPLKKTWSKNAIPYLRLPYLTNIFLGHPVEVHNCLLKVVSLFDNNFSILVFNDVFLEIIDTKSVLEIYFSVRKSKTLLQTDI